MDYFELIGIVGATLILVAFVMEQLHKWKDTDLKYDVFNAIGGTLMVVYAYLLGSYPFLILNMVWAAVSIRDVINDLRKPYGNQSK